MMDKLLEINLFRQSHAELLKSTNGRLSSRNWAEILETYLDLPPPNKLLLAFHMKLIVDTVLGISDADIEAGDVDFTAEIPDSFFVTAHLMMDRVMKVVGLISENYPEWLDSLDMEHVFAAMEKDVLKIATMKQNLELSKLKSDKWREEQDHKFEQIELILDNAQKQRADLVELYTQKLDKLKSGDFENYEDYKKARNVIDAKHEIQSRLIKEELREKILELAPDYYDPYCDSCPFHMARDSDDEPWKCPKCGFTKIVHDGDIP